MKTTELILNLAVLLGVFSAEAHAQFPNAWQINDNSTATGSTLNYYTNLTAAQFSAAITNGWRFTVTGRMVTSYGSANGAMYLLFGDGTNRYGFNLNLDSSGRLVVNPLVGSQVVVTPDASTATNYHTHELDFDPATQQVTYFFDGAPLANWSAQAINADAGEPVWGSVSSADKGQMNFHRVQFEIIGQGTVASYYAGFDGNPAVAPSPTTQGWTRFSGGVSIPEGPVSPDGLAAPPLVTTLAASALSASNATLGAVLYPGSGPTAYYFEYGTTTNYGNFSATNTVSGGVNATNVTTAIGGLMLVTAYHFRAVASNDAGISLGHDQTFTTTRLLPNAWQINDNAAVSGVLQYQTNLTAGQVAAADSGGWHYELVSRMVSGGATPSQSMAFGDGTRRFYLFFNLDGAGELTAQLLGDGTNYLFTLTSATEGTNYHTHEMTYDPATGNATYRFDGGMIATWAGQASAGQSDQVMWGANASSGTGAMDYHSAEFDINGEGVIASYDAGFEDDPDMAPSPTNQAWTRFTSGTALPEGPLSPDLSPLPPVVTLAASDVTPASATLNAQLHPDGLDTACWFEYGTTASYGSFSLTNTIPAGVIETNLSSGVNGLAPETTYHFRAVATNLTGVLTGADKSFTTPAYVTTLPATSLTPFDATLNASFHADELGLAYYWEYGPTTDYGAVTPANILSAGAVAPNASDTASGLSPGTTYHFRAVATNSDVVATGEDLSFTTPPFYPLGAGVEGAAVAWGDYDNDGRLDLLLTGYNSASSSEISQLWRNTGAGFTNVLIPGLPGVEFGSVAWGDYDNDGRLDFLITGYDQNTGTVISQVWHNNGDGTFSNVTTSVAPGLPGVDHGSVAWGDYDNDGRPDILLAGRDANYNLITLIWRNNGNGTFSNVTATAAPGLPGVYGGMVAWGDYDGDGRLDILLTGTTNANYSTGDSEIWHNNGDGTFSNVTATVAPGLPQVYESSAAWGDYDNDGRLDFILAGTDGVNAICRVWHNTGSGFTYMPIPGLPGTDSGSVAWGDYDNDGRLDFLLTGSHPAGGNDISQLWRNTGTGFTNVPVAGLPGFKYSSVAWGDANNDGRLDLLLTGTDGSNDYAQVWPNLTGASNTPPSAPSGLTATTNFPLVSLSWNPASDAETPADGLTYNLRVGTTPGGSDVVNPEAGASGFRRVPAMGNVQTGTNAVLVLTAGTYYWSVQAVDAAFAGSPFAAEGSFSVSSLPIVFTLAATEAAPSSAVLNASVNPNNLPTGYYFEYGLTTNYGNATGTNTLPAGILPLNVGDSIGGLSVATTYHFRIVAENSTGIVTGEDRTFTTPHFLTEGLPAFLTASVAWGDYDRDGHLDLAMVGDINHGFSADVWRNTGAGFTNLNVGISATENELGWADYDNDGDLDLLILDSSVNLWRNDASHFALATTSLGKGDTFLSGSLTWGDFDNDGRNDLLLTGENAPARNPATQIWRNTGSDFASNNVVLPGIEFGSVAWGDYDNDGRLDFVLTGYDYDIDDDIAQIWHNNGDGTFSNVTAVVAPGLPEVVASSVAWGDYDNDGRLDLLLAGTTNSVTSGAICQVWHNTGSGFTNLNLDLPGVCLGSVAWGDYNNDGRLDILLTGTTNGYASGAIAQVWRNTGSGFTNLNLGLPGVYASYDYGNAAAFGDYNNDGRLDILLAGTTTDSNGLCEVWINNEPATNTVPTAPTGLTATAVNGEMQLRWNPAADAQTPSAGLSYNVRVGTAPGGNEVVSPEANDDGFRLLPALGNAQMRTNAILDLPPGTYYWSVQAVDTSFAGGPFAPETSFTLTLPTLSIVSSNSDVVISWQPSYPGVVLQESPGLNPAAWTNSPSGATDPITIPVANETMFYRLFKP